jgi:rhamnosyl/mannosyltransferase
LSINCNLYKNKNFKRFSSETIFVGFLGRHARYKGIDILLRACSRIQETHVNIAGDGPFRSQAEILTNELKMTSRVTFLGDITLFNQKLNFYNSIDIFVFPSTEITETFGIVQLEAMVMEIPVVSSNLPTGVTDVAIHGRTALLIRPGNINDLVRAIFRLKKDKRLRKRLIFQAKKHVTKNFNDHINMKKTLQVFQDCLSQV